MTAPEEIIEGSSSRALLDSLVARVRDGSDDAVNDLLRVARPLVFRWAYVRTGDRDDAEDVTQKVLMRVHAGVREFEGRSSFTSWLYRITANTAAESYRTRGVFDRLKRRFRSIGHTTSVETDMVRVIEDGRVRDLIQSIVNGLPARQRTALDLVDLQGYTPGEAAEMESLNATTFRVHLMRARRTVRSRILAGAEQVEREGINDP